MMVEAPRRWPHPHDLKPEAVLAFLKANEPMMDHGENKELLRVLSWALPLYGRMKDEENQSCRPWPVIS